MNKEFIPYEQALELKELGFDDYNIAWYAIVDEKPKMVFLNWDSTMGCLRYGSHLCAPLYQQAFRWFREKYGIVGIVKFGTQEFTYNIYNNDAIGLLTKDSLDFNGTYEEAEIACLKKLIELVKGKEVAINCHTYD